MKSIYKLLAATVAFASTAAAPSASAAIISFADTTSTGDLSTYTEAGYIFTYLSGDVNTISNENFASNSLQTGSVSSPERTGTFSITQSGGGLFSIGSFETFTTQSATPTTVTFELAGFLADTNTFNQTLSASGLLYNRGSATLTPSLVGNLFDRLNVTFRTSTSSAYIDNISLNAAAVPPAVPEPATWAMMTLGFGALGFVMRRKKVSTRIRLA